MRSLDFLSESQARSLDGLLFDLDDTLLDHGRLSLEAYTSLFRLRESGLELIAATGRPAGWGEVIARQWPIAGVVSENGAVSLYRKADVLCRLDAVDEAERQRRRKRVAVVVAKIREAFPKLQPADDVAARVSDFTFDIGENTQAAPELVRAAAALARQAGARTQTSSVHLHITFDADDKATGSVRLIRLLFGTDPTLARWRYAFIGDSENDSTCFAAFRTSLTVKNFRGRPTVTPRYQTLGVGGAGFAEAAAHLVKLRGA
ncbi:MAG: HAD hydrolase family protein [Myxococcales bacterium]|nr:HAD hydrolase family protein [Myxococcales bacterium]